MIYIDTNCFIRLLTNDHPLKAQKVVLLLKSGLPLSVNDVVFPEIEYVLREVYKAPREKIISSYKLITSLSGVKISKIVKKAVFLYENSNLDMADCIIASESMNGKLASFDEKLLKIKSIKKYWEL